MPMPPPPKKGPPTTPKGSKPAPAKKPTKPPANFGLLR